MSIANAETKDLIPLNQAIRTEIPGEPSASTTWRWITRGLAPADDSEPRIRLAVVFVGRQCFTTRSAIREFMERATQARLARMARTQQRSTDVTDAELTAAGLRKPR
ncbi:MAG: hypothetical protein KDA96_23080 [Planctomycetaceae bacterium]|nr:hypothetical protein [Planctomycetaceae bacterium]